jgi:cysteine-rich repeat protein
MTVCGDGFVVGDEQCDDGGTAPGDGCDDTCQVELYSRCDGASPSTCAPVDILYLIAGPDDATYRTNVSAITGGTVDYWAGQTTVPSLTELDAYDCVLTESGNAYADKDAWGATLAQFVDSGRSAVLSLVSGYSNGAGFVGTPIMGTGYSPLVTAGTLDSSGQSYQGDGTSPLFFGVTTLEGTYAEAGAAVQGAGIADGTYADGNIVSGYRPDYRVVFMNGSGHSAWWGTVSGDWPRFVANACSLAFVQ